MKQTFNDPEKSWERITVTLSLIIRRESVLMGEILGGTIKGFITPPGGKKNPGDNNIKATADREMLEETGLTGLDGEEVAKVTIKIRGRRRVILLHVFKYTHWVGRLKVETREFSYLRFFPIKSIPWDKLAHGDETWMKSVLTGKRLNAVVLCGEDRTKVEKITIKYKE